MRLELVAHEGWELLAMGLQHDVLRFAGGIVLLDGAWLPSSDFRPLLGISTRVQLQHDVHGLYGRTRLCVGSRRGLLGIRRLVRKCVFVQRLCRIVRLCVEWPH